MRFSGRTITPFFCGGLALAVPLVGDARAPVIEEAQAAYAEGRFRDAAQIAESDGTSQGLVLAAQSLTEHGYFVVAKGGRKVVFERAAALAQSAIRADPDNADAHLQLARATGRLAQAVGSFEAAERGYAGVIREAAETSLRLDPGLALAHLALGRWHAGVVNAVGPLLARITYGARESHAIASLEQALKLVPDSKEITLQYALGLLEMDEDDYRDKAMGLLKRAIALPARDALDRLLHKQAVERLNALESSGG